MVRANKSKGISRAGSMKKDSPGVLQQVHIDKPVKLALVKELKSSLDMSYSKIGRTLGMTRKTIQRYEEQTTPEEWIHYQTSVKKILLTKENEIISDVIARIQEQVPDSTIVEATNVYKTIKEGQKQDNKGQVNISGDGMNVEFISTQ